jgi:hypothetical protein
MSDGQATSPATRSPARYAKDIHTFLAVIRSGNRSAGQALRARCRYHGKGTGAFMVQCCIIFSLTQKGVHCNHSPYGHGCGGVRLRLLPGPACFPETYTEIAGYKAGKRGGITPQTRYMLSLPADHGNHALAPGGQEPSASVSCCYYGRRPGRRSALLTVIKSRQKSTESANPFAGIFRITSGASRCRLADGGARRRGGPEGYRVA